MPRGDGTGPVGGGRGRNAGGRKGRNNGPYAAGPSGICICPQCGLKMPHIAGESCMSNKCPECGTQMARG